ncbi:hypothetical protein LMJ53_08110 [Rheinheimera sp. UJ51]|uniref:hypothetical protein n=1 Tax=Rheinheimera sp. UJ51 TaxID=2892446 RepID=UPI001E4EA057|nr:hypothetical protein [Rheinheimera sp. UJ51]MCC5451688.1 hypothetical protein [Rheinheimera sp. UJ51]
MLEKNKATQQGGQIKIKAEQLNHNNNQAATPKQIERVLFGLLYKTSLNCQEAEKLPIKARHLNSVISELTHTHGLEINREREKVKGYQGESCYLMRYSVCSHHHSKARELIDQWRAKRNAKPIAWLKLRVIPLESHLRTE